MQKSELCPLYTEEMNFVFVLTEKFVQSALGHLHQPIANPLITNVLLTTSCISKYDCSNLYLIPCPLTLVLSVN
jgi:hypothetical protein